MSENNLSKKKKTLTPDWFVQGILSRLGDIFDKLTGRGWQGTSSLATSELSEKLKMILDSEIKDLGNQGRFVPHNIKLKMQWNKFATDSDDVTKKLENELMIAAIDHINDKLYHTYQPLKIEVKPDYFTEGIKFYASFGEFDKEETEVEVNVTVPQMKVQDLIPEVVEAEPEGEVIVADFSVGEKRKAVELRFMAGKRMGVGRTKENDLCIEDGSISKVHAALVLNSEDQLMVADTGSTNGTFINGNRIAYGRAFVIEASDKVKFGTVEVFLRRVPKEVDFATQENYEVAQTEAFQLEPQPTIAVPQPTEAFQSESQPAETIAPPIVHPAIPQIPENNLADALKTNPPTQIENIPKEVLPTQIEDIPKEIPPPRTENVPMAQPTVSPEEFVPETVAGNTNYEVNVTEPRVQLNFEDEEKK